MLSPSDAVTLQDVARNSPSFGFLYGFLAKDNFGSTNVSTFLRDKELRDTLFERVMVGGDAMRAKLFVDFVCECQRALMKGSVRRHVQALAHHVYPPASNDSTCPVLFVDKNVDDPGKFRSPYGNTFTDARLAVDFDTVPMSGSAQFGEQGLKVIAERIRSLRVDWFRVLVVDLRQEPHCFVDIEHGSDWNKVASTEVVPQPYMAACWMTQHDFGIAGLTDTEGRMFEKLLRTMLMRQIEVSLTWPLKTEVKRGVFVLKGVKSEKELVRAEEFKYVRLYCTDHVRPHDHTVDEFVQLVRRYHGKAKVFYHFHCHGGMGRTTTFMAMYDMLLNAASHRDLTVQDFVDRQKLISTYDLNSPAITDDALKFKNIFAKQRFEFLQFFHLFATLDPLSNKQLTWAAFLKTKDAELEALQRVGGQGGQGGSAPSLSSAPTTTPTPNGKSGKASEQERK